jgi:hypothetical protein
MTQPESYKPTFFDRHGPAGALRLHALKHALVAFGLSLLMFGTLGSQKLGLSGIVLIVFTLVSAGTLSGLAYYLGLKLGDSAGTAAELVYMGGDSTPYEEQFSQEQALVMKREYGRALELFESRILAAPNEPRVRIAAADLYATHGANPKRAAELYREVQRIPSLATGQDVFVSNKLADLYLGPLDEPGRALVEFRRLVHLYPNSKAAQHARMAIANLKPDVLKPESR